MTHRVKCFLCKHEELSSDPQKSRKVKHGGMHLQPLTWGWRGGQIPGAPWPTRIAESENPSSKRLWRKDGEETEENILPLTLGLHTLSRCAQTWIYIYIVHIYIYVHAHACTYTHTSMHERCGAESHSLLMGIQISSDFTRQRSSFLHSYKNIYHDT